MYLFKLELSPDTYPEVGLLDHMVAVLTGFWGTFILLEVNDLHQLHPHQQCGKFAFASHLPQHLLCVDFWWWPFDWCNSQVAPVVTHPPANAADARDVDSIPGLRISPRVGNGNRLQYSCLENSIDRGAWWTAVMGLQRVGHDWARMQAWGDSFKKILLRQIIQLVWGTISGKDLSNSVQQFVTSSY